MIVYLCVNESSLNRGWCRGWLNHTYAWQSGRGPSAPAYVGMCACSAVLYRLCAVQQQQLLQQQMDESRLAAAAPLHGSSHRLCWQQW
jgi:hypothetical protein